MRQRHFWNYFAYSQIQMVEGKIVPAMLLPREAKDTQLFGIFKI